VRSPLPLSCRALMERWYQSVIMGLSSGERVGTAPGECPAISEETRDTLARLDRRSGHPAGRRATLAEDGTCREAAYLNSPVERTAGSHSLAADRATLHHLKPGETHQRITVRAMVIETEHGRNLGEKLREIVTDLRQHR